MALQAADLILQPPTGSFERIIDRKWQIGMAFVGFGGARNVDFPAIRQGKPDVHLVQSAGQVMAAWALEDDATGRQATKSLLEIGDMLFNRSASVRICIDALKVNVYGRLHGASWQILILGNARRASGC
jgi:hypothetical protein